FVTCSLIPRSLRSTLFPYTTLFRSLIFGEVVVHRIAAACRTGEVSSFKLDNAFRQVHSVHRRALATLAELRHPFSLCRQKQQHLPVLIQRDLGGKGSVRFRHRVPSL